MADELRWKESLHSTAIPHPFDPDRYAYGKGRVQDALKLSYPSKISTEDPPLPISGEEGKASGPNAHDQAEAP